MTRRLLLIIPALISAMSLSAQDYPYQKVMDASTNELEAQNFLYYKDKNYYELNFEKASGFFASILLDADMHSTDDYNIFVQMGAEGQKSSMTVTIYDRSIYETILDFADDYGENIKTHNTSRGEKTTFTYDGMKFSIARQKVEVKDTNTTTGSNEKGTVSTSNSTTTDYSYDKFIYVVDTGIEPSSPWHDKQKAKADKRRDKGQKSTSSADFL